jgi:hypothetical protein
VPILQVNTGAGIARVTIDNPPVNVPGFGLMTELSTLPASLARTRRSG